MAQEKFNKFQWLAVGVIFLIEPMETINQIAVGFGSFFVDFLSQ